MLRLPSSTPYIRIVYRKKINYHKVKIRKKAIVHVKMLTVYLNVLARTQPTIESAHTIVLSNKFLFFFFCSKQKMPR